ncbi:apicoplast pyruvate carrier 1-like [Babylonia areolata]|uniref:apicoplast pyruvate carrier 1-like n=1 Tax=Babylonia areolata TaxID=304850 RepID=UPI003FD643F8
MALDQPNGSTASPESTMNATTPPKTTTEKEEKVEVGVARQCWKAVSCLFHRYRKYTVVLGGIFVYIPIGVPWYFGNLATYLSSYFRELESRRDAVVDPQWIFSAFFVAFSTAIVLSGYLANSLGTRPTILIAILIHSGATFLSYFATQHSMVGLILTFGAVGGLGAGLAYGPPMPTVSRWLPRNVGMASGVLLTGFGGGAVIYNELITFYINPNNIQPDVTTDRTSYFSQREVLDKIPEVFLVLGFLTLAIQLLGLALIRDPGEGDEVEEPESTELKPIINKESTSAGELNEVELQSDAASQSAQAEAEPRDMSPVDVLKQKDFYILWLALGLNHYGYVIKNNYYKEFGAAKVDNDHLLTTIGTVSTIAVAISRLCWGLICDLIGIKMTVMVLVASTAVFSSFWFFTLMAGPGLYFLWTVVVTWILAGAFIIFPLAALSSFGQRHYATNYGLISTVQIVVNLVSPPLIRALLDSYGWFGVFISIATSNLVGTIAALFLSIK